ncbi:hypothetical protein EDE12_11242 [Methylosinus sp. sav-2]|uniref:hypothetical protein n=1 Tax=Methylosinus sp. sav-2 TaxID=2485168 RepID=UPI00068DCF6B|nr:hypothetical protein [Methylosinus sp. sav-2]TDX61941.1 hypothetical protein EDE12_11242 [Methylosinus sp. sav-2]
MAGRKPFEPSEDQRRQVEAFAAYGIPQEDMCKLLLNPRTGKPIDLKTLHKHFRVELDTGMVRANAKVAESLFRQAVGAAAQYDANGKLIRAEQTPVVSAGIFWAKARMGWKERDVHEFTGENGGPIEVDDARSKLADRLARLAAASAAREGSGEPQPE